MVKPTTKQYNKIVEALLSKGYTVDTPENKSILFEDLQKTNFKVSLKGKRYRIYIARIIALMHSRASEEGECLEL